MAEIIDLPQPAACLEYFIPSLLQPVGGPINGDKDYRKEFDELQRDQRTAWEFAKRHGLAVLTVAGDRNGAYLVVSATPRLRQIFGEEAARWRWGESNGSLVEYWLGLIDERIRVFWREIKCVH